MCSVIKKFLYQHFFFLSRGHEIKRASRDMEKIKEMFSCKNRFNIFCTRFRIDSGVVCSFSDFMNVVNLLPSLREDLIHCSATARNVVVRTQKQFIVEKTCCYNIFFVLAF